MNWMQNTAWYADGLHVLGGAAGVLAAVALWGHAGLFALLMLVYAAFKEFYIDIHYETGQTYLDGIRDFAGYFVGMLLAIGVEWIR